eukprot:COSAG06_NODE_3554_length_5196_cov_4.040024_5_plen_63_part_00
MMLQQDGIFPLRPLAPDGRHRIQGVPDIKSYDNYMKSYHITIIRFHIVNNYLILLIRYQQPL